MKKTITEHRIINTFIGGIQTKAEVYNPEINDIETVILWDEKKHDEAYQYLLRVGHVIFVLVENFEELLLSIELMMNDELFLVESKRTLKITFLQKLG